jgi:hypothetical protein
MHERKGKRVFFVRHHFVCWIISIVYTLLFHTNSFRPCFSLSMIQAIITHKRQHPSNIFHQIMVFAIFHFSPSNRISNHFASHIIKSCVSKFVANMGILCIGCWKRQNVHHYRQIFDSIICRQKYPKMNHHSILILASLLASSCLNAHLSIVDTGWPRWLTSTFSVVAHSGVPRKHISIQVIQSIIDRLLCRFRLLYLSRREMRALFAFEMMDDYDRVGHAAHL